MLSQWEELAARGSTRTALKAVLQRRLHGLLVQAAIAHHAAEDEAHGGGAATAGRTRCHSGGGAGAASGRRGHRTDSEMANQSAFTHQSTLENIEPVAGQLATTPLCALAICYL